MPRTEPQADGMPQGLRAWSFERWVGLLTLACSIIAVVFGLGVNWAHITEQDARQRAFEEAANKTFLRADVYQAEQRHLADAVERLTRALETLQENERERSIPRGRMFDK